MPKVSKFTDEQKVGIALDLLCGKLSHAEVCRKYGISSTSAYKVKDRSVAGMAGVSICRSASRSWSNSPGIRPWRFGR